MNTQTSEKNSFTANFLREKDNRKQASPPAFLFINLRLNLIKHAVIDLNVFFDILISERALHHKITEKVII